MPWYLGVVVLAALVGVWACGATARDLGRGDPGAIVWDEVVGFLVTMTAAPPGWVWVLLGFALFRLFDIWKPWPIRALDARVHGGLGIMLDDLVAGLLAWAVLQGIARIARVIPGHAARNDLTASSPTATSWPWWIDSCWSRVAIDPLEVLLAAGLLAYPDYEAWRLGRGPDLGLALRVGPEAAVDLLQRAAAFARALRLVPEPLSHTTWGEPVRPLRVSGHLALIRACGEAQVPAADRPATGSVPGQPRPGS